MDDRPSTSLTTKHQREHTADGLTAIQVPLAEHQRGVLTQLNNLKISSKYPPLDPSLVPEFSLKLALWPT